jgi:hypothetical protein
MLHVNNNIEKAKISKAKLNSHSIKKDMNIVQFEHIRQIIRMNDAHVANILNNAFMMLYRSESYRQY